MQANQNRSEFQHSSNKNHIKKLLIDKFFKNDAYSEGEYVKNEQSLPDNNANNDEDKEQNQCCHIDVNEFITDLN